MANSKHELALIIKAVDKATGPLRAINQRMQAATAPFQNSLKQLKDQFGKDTWAGGVLGALKNVGGAARNVGASVNTMLGGFARMGAVALGAGVGMFALVKQTVNAGDKLNEMSKQVGLGVDAYAQLQFAAAQADIEQDEFNAGLGTFNKNLGEARGGTGRLYASLLKWAPGLAKQVKGVKSTEEALTLMTQAFEKVQDPARRAALANKAFGNKQFGQFLGQGSKALEEQKARFLELAGSQEKLASTSDVVDNAMRETEVAFTGAKNAALVELFPALTTLSKALAEIFVKNRDAIRKWGETAGQALAAWVANGGLERLTTSLSDLAQTLGTVINMVGGPKGVVVAFAAFQLLPVIASVGGLALALVQLNIALGVTFAGFAFFSAAASGFAAAAAAIGAGGYAIYKNWEPLKELFTDIGQLWAVVKDVATTSGFEMISNAGDWWKKELGFGADKARPVAAGASKSETRVQVDFSNLPAGARVNQESGGTTPLELNMSYAGAAP